MRDREDISPEVALRLRYIQLERLAESNQTCCDLCKEIKRKSRALEVWSNKTNVFVICFSCMRKSDLLMQSTPSGLELNSIEKEFQPLLRPANVLLPSQHAPKGF